MLIRENLSNGQQIEIRNEKEFVIQFAPLNCIKIFKNITSMELAIDNKSNTLMTYKLAYGEDCINDYLQIWITTVNNFFNFKTAMSPMQIQMTANFILTDFHQLTIPDIYLIFTKAMKGEYGELFQSLDGAKILTWFRNYFNERCDLIFDKNLKADSKNSYNVLDNIWENAPESTKNAIKDLLKNKVVK